MNKTTTILKEFREIYFNGRYGERLMKRNLVKGYTTTATAKDIEKFFVKKLQEVEKNSWIEALECIRDNSSGNGDYRRKIAIKLAHLKGEK